MKKIIKHKNIILFISFITITIIGFLCHEIWEDEAQEYLIIKNLDLIGIFKNAYLEGHPVLYYYILYPFIKVGFGPRIVNIISLIFMYIGVYIIIFKLKINDLLKILFITHYSVIYQYSLIGRSYSLVFLLILLITYYYKERDERSILYSVLLGLLLNTHLLAVPFSIILFIFTYIDKIKNKKLNKKDYIGIITYLLFCILLFMQFYKLMTISNGMSLSKDNLFLSFLGVFFGAPLFIFNNSHPFLTVFGYIFFFYTFYIFYKSDKKIFLIELLNYIIFVLLYSKISGLFFYTHRLNFYFFFLIFGLSNINYKYNRKEYILIILVIIIGLIMDIRSYCLEINYKYSDGLSASKYIRNNINKENTIYTVSDREEDVLVLPVILYSDNYKFYNLNSNKYYKYVIWNKEREKKLDYKNICKELNKNNKSYLLLTKNYENKEKLLNKLSKDYKVKVLYTSDKKSITKESYILYERTK